MRPRDAPAPGAQLCFGQVWHRRLRPVVNEFRYGTFYLRLPLRALGGDGFGCALARRNGAALLSFHDADHGDGTGNLVGWIDALLAREGVSGADGEVWLQTMPRVLGFVFNPVSFWFCHCADGALRAVLCDVRNTFGERHFYLLDSGAPLEQGCELKARKVFHVSPFCRIEGGYRFRFSRGPHPDGEYTLARIEHDDADGVLLQTSVGGHAAALANRAVLRALLAYPLMTFAVVARIHWQALRLWLRRVPFHTKPIPPEHEVSK